MLELPVPVASLTIDTTGSTIADTILQMSDTQCGASIACNDDNGTNYLSAFWAPLGTTDAVEYLAALAVIVWVAVRNVRGFTSRRAKGVLAIVVADIVLQGGLIVLGVVLFFDADLLTGQIGELERTPGLSAGAWQMRPLSRGYVEARSNQPGDMPAINPLRLATFWSGPRPSTE